MIKSIATIAGLCTILLASPCPSSKVEVFYPPYKDKDGVAHIGETKCISKKEYKLRLPTNDEIIRSQTKPMDDAIKSGRL